MASSSGVSKSPGVTPCVGVWIETATGLVTVNQGGVTPCVGVWIETSTNILIGDLAKVTPCVGVWIETAIIIWKRVMLQSHTLRGCVD